MSQIYLNPESIKDGSITIEKLDVTAAEVLGGVPIVDSMDALDENAKHGSLSVVVNHEEFDEIFDVRNTYVGAENPQIINELRMSYPEMEIPSGDEGATVWLCKNGLTIEEAADSDGIELGVGFTEGNAEAWAYSFNHGDFMFIQPPSTEINSDNVKALNDIITDWGGVTMYGVWREGGTLEEPTEREYEILNTFLGYSEHKIIDETTLYIKDAEGWKEFSQTEIVNNLEDGGIDKALSAEMGKVLNEKISGFITGNTTEPIKFKGYVNVETTNDIDKIYDNMQIGEACLVAPSLKGDADSDSYVPWIYTATQKDYLPLGEDLLKSDISKVLSGEIRTYFTLDKEDPYWRCPDMLLLAKVKVKIKQFIGIIDMSSTLRNILSLLPDSAEITACIGKILRWSIGDAMPQFVEEIFREITTIQNDLVDSIGYKTKYPWGTKFDDMLTNGVCAYTPDEINGINENWTGFVTCSTDSDGSGYYHFTQKAICRTGNTKNMIFERMGWYKKDTDNISDLNFTSWVPNHIPTTLGRVDLYADGTATMLNAEMFESVLPLDFGQKNGGWHIMGVAKYDSNGDRTSMSYAPAAIWNNIYIVFDPEYTLWFSKNSDTGVWELANLEPTGITNKGTSLIEVTSNPDSKVVPTDNTIAINTSNGKVFFGVANKGWWFVTTQKLGNAEVIDDTLLIQAEYNDGSISVSGEVKDETLIL